MYCTIEQAREAGAVGSDPAVAQAIARADLLIDRYTASLWETRTLTVAARVAPNGTALLPYPVQALTSVTPVGGGTPAALPPTSYYFTSELQADGQTNALVLGAQGWSDPLVVGAEPWRGGWAGYLERNLGSGQVLVVGTYGPPVTPLDVQVASAALAAWLTGPGAELLPPTASPVPDTDDEGNAVSITVDAEAVARPARSTGLSTVDALLAPYVRAQALIS